MQKEVGKMMTGRIQTKALNIQHMGEPRERVPIGSVAGRKSPLKALQCKSLLHMHIVGDVFIVVIRDKFVVFYLPVDCDGHKHEQCTKNESLTHEGIR